MMAGKEFNKRRAIFMKLAAADDLPPILVKLAYLIAFQEIDLKTQTTRRTHATLAARMGVTPRTIQRLLVILTKRCGLIVQSGRGRHQMDTYWIGPLPAENTTPMSHFSSRKCDMENATPMSHVLNKTPTEEPIGSSYGEGRESERPSAVYPPPSAGAFEGPAPEEDKEAVPSPARAEILPPPRSKPDGYKESFNALRRVWARPWADADDDAAFRLYCTARVEVGHAAILEAALAWVAAADAPRFLPSRRADGRNCHRKKLQRRKRQGAHHRRGKSAARHSRCSWQVRRTER
jgi:hypothetical protein